MQGDRSQCRETKCDICPPRYNSPANVLVLAINLPPKILILIKILKLKLKISFILLQYYTYITILYEVAKYVQGINVKERMRRVR